MEDDSIYTAYCGLYCRDCIPCNRRLFSLVRDLEGELTEVHFGEYAKLKSRGDAVFGDYPDFLMVLRAIQDLECRVACRAGGGKATCAVRDCVLGQGLSGCWECDRYRTCEALDPLKRFHPNLEHHLSLILREGIDSWSAGRRGHYSWQ